MKTQGYCFPYPLLSVVLKSNWRKRRILEGRMDYSTGSYKDAMPNVCVCTCTGAHPASYDM